MSSPEWCFMAFTGQLTSISLIHVAIFIISYRNKFLNFFVFLYLRDSVRSPDTKRTLIRPWYVGLMEVKHEAKATSMIKRLNMSFTSFIPDCLWFKKFQGQILYKRF